MPADDGLQLIFSHVGAFHHDLLAHHHRRRGRQVQLKIFIRLVFGNGLGDDYAFEMVLLAQPGHHLEKMLSRIAVGLIQEKSDFNHDFLL